MHERYSGPLKYRITVIGNQTFSGLYSIAWSPRRIQGNSVVISELQKYAYESKAIALPENGCYLLHDARKNNFYREVDDTDDIDDRPHLVVFVHMTAVSPLREGITIRIRVASCLADGNEGAGTFQVALPRLLGQSPAINNQPTGALDTLLQRLTGSSLMPVIIRPIEKDTRNFYSVLEGNIFQQTMDTYTDHALTEWNKYPWMDCIHEPISTAPDQNRYAFIGGQLSTAGGYNLNVKWFSYVSGERIQNPALFNRLGSAANKAYMDHKDEENGSMPWFEAFVKQLNEDPGTPFVVHQYTRSIVVADQTKIEFHQAGKTVEYELAEGRPVNEFIIYTNFGPIYVLAMDTTPITHTLDVGTGIHITTESHNWFMNKSTQITNLNLVQEGNGMPAGWMNCIFTADKPKPVNSPIRSYININHVSLKSLIDFIAPTIRVTECLQFVLNDLDSGGTIMTCRYLSDRQCVVVNVGTALDNNIYYYVSNRPLQSMYVSSIVIIPRINTFPITDLRSFIDNTITGAGRFDATQYNAGGAEDVQPNMSAGMILGSIAGGGLSGIGQGLSDAINNQWKRTENWRDRDLAKWLAEYKGGNMSDMQKQQLDAIMEQMQKQFGYNQQLQQNQFDFQREMAGGAWGQQSRMQQAGFEQANAMQRQDFLNTQENAILGQEMAGYRSPSMAYSSGEQGHGKTQSIGTPSIGSDTSSLPAYQTMDTQTDQQPLPTKNPYDKGIPSWSALMNMGNKTTQMGRDTLAGVPIDEEYIGPSDSSDTSSEYSTASSGAGSYSSASSGLSGPRETPKNDSTLHGPANPIRKNDSFLHSNPYAQQRAPSTSSPMKSGRPNTIRVGGARPAWRGGNTISIKH